MLGAKNVLVYQVTDSGGCRLFDIPSSEWRRCGCALFILRENVAGMAILSLVTQSGGNHLTRLKVLGDDDTSIKFYHDGNHTYVKCNYSGGTAVGFILIGCPSAARIGSLDVSGMTEITRS